MAPPTVFPKLLTVIGSDGDDRIVEPATAFDRIDQRTVRLIVERDLGLIDVSHDVLLLGGEFPLVKVALAGKLARAFVQDVRQKTLGGRVGTVGIDRQYHQAERGREFFQCGQRLAGDRVGRGDEFGAPHPARRPAEIEFASRCKTALEAKHTAYVGVGANQCAAVAVGFEQARERGQVLRQAMRAPFGAVMPRQKTRQQGGHRRSRPGCIREDVLEHHTPIRESVEPGRARRFVSVGTQPIGAQGIDYVEEDVWRACERRR